MRPHWGNGGTASSGGSRKDHIITEYASYQMWDSQVWTLCNRRLKDERKATGDRCQQCVVCLEALLR